MSNVHEGGTTRGGELCHINQGDALNMGKSGGKKKKRKNESSLAKRVRSQFTVGKTGGEKECGDTCTIEHVKRGSRGTTPVSRYQCQKKGNRTTASLTGDSNRQTKE